MSHRHRTILTVGGLMLVALGVFLPGLGWGLPSRAVDPLLFGDEPVWSGERILELAGSWGADAGAQGADVDLNPLASRDEPIWVNRTDAQKAEIIRRYRLFSQQPDEMITFRSLAQMSPGQLDLDPQLYQYGGLWIYPVGALLQTGRLLGLVDLRSDVAFYLDHPDAFGRFYVVARLYVVLWGLVGVWAVFWIVRRMTGGLVLPAAGALCYILMPAVVNMAHEAKPHLPAAVLILLAVMAGAKTVETGKARWWGLTGALCGAAFGMVLSALWAFSIVPAATLAMPQASWRGRVVAMVVSGLVGVAVYCVTNPYVPVRFIDEYVIGPEVGPLRSNLANSQAMYVVGRWGEGLVNAARLIAHGTSPVLAIAGVIGAVGLVVHSVRYYRRGACDETCKGRGDAGWMLVPPVGLIVLQFVALAAGKPAEYARFAILPDIALAVAAVAGMQVLLRREALQWLACVAFVVVTFSFGLPYWLSFVRNDAHRAALRAKNLPVLEPPGGEIAVWYEPAPWSMPAVNLFDNRIMLLPTDARPEAVDADLAIAPAGVLPISADAPELTPMSWASKRFYVAVAEPR